MAKFIDSNALNSLLARLKTVLSGMFVASENGNLVNPNIVNPTFFDVNESGESLGPTEFVPAVRMVVDDELYNCESGKILMLQEDLGLLFDRILGDCNLCPVKIYIRHGATNIAEVVAVRLRMESEWRLMLSASDDVFRYTLSLYRNRLVINSAVRWDGK